MYRSKITKEEVNELPVDEFAGNIIVIDDMQKAEEAFKYLNTQKVIGMDTETKPSFKRGVVHKVSLLQIATRDVCYLFRLNKIGFPNKLVSVLSNDKITKVGLALRDDLNGLFKQHKFSPESFVDLQHEVENYGILELSLQKIYAITFGKKISKSQRLTNWENETLTAQQQIYAATDAWATLQIFLRLQQESRLTKNEIEQIKVESLVIDSLILNSNKR